MNDERTRSGAGSRVVRMGAFLLLLVFSVAAGLVAWTGGYFGAAFVTSSPAGLIVGGAIALLLTTGGSPTSGPQPNRR